MNPRTKHESGGLGWNGQQALAEVRDEAQLADCIINESRRIEKIRCVDSSMSQDVMEIASYDSDMAVVEAVARNAFTSRRTLEYAVGRGIRDRSVKVLASALRNRNLPAKCIDRIADFAADNHITELIDFVAGMKNAPDAALKRVAEAGNRRARAIERARVIAKSAGMRHGGFALGALVAVAMALHVIVIL